MRFDESTKAKYELATDSKEVKTNGTVILSQTCTRSCSIEEQKLLRNVKVASERYMLIRWADTSLGPYWAHMCKPTIKEGSQGIVHCKQPCPGEI